MTFPSKILNSGPHGKAEIYRSNDDDEDDDDDYNGGDADRLITLTVTGCPLLRIGEKAMMLSHSIPDHHYDDYDG